MVLGLFAAARLAGCSCTSTSSTHSRRLGPRRRADPKRTRDIRGRRASIGPPAQSGQSVGEARQPLGPPLLGVSRPSLHPPHSGKRDWPRAGRAVRLCVAVSCWNVLSLRSMPQPRTALIQPTVCQRLDENWIKTGTLILSAALAEAIDEGRVIPVGHTAARETAPVIGAPMANSKATLC
jgi:hypothetical protein